MSEVSKSEIRNPKSEIKGALEGIRVLDLSQFLSGPRASQLLAEKGADVIKIESPVGETMRLLAMMMPGCERVMSTMHFNKRGIVLDLKKERGREVFKELVKKSDVLIENLAPGTMDRIGVGYKVLKEINPGLIYASITGFGLDGPFCDRTAFDIISQASGGSMSAIEREDRPPALFIGDLISGAYCCVGILEALIYRGKTGKGQLVDISMQDVVFANHFQAFAEFALRPVQEQIKSVIGRSIINLLTDHTNPIPFWNSYKAKDGYVAIVAITDGQWKRLMKAMGREDLIDDERFGNLITRIKNAEEGIKIIEEWTSNKTMEEIVSILSEERVPSSEVKDINMLWNDPQLRAREMITEVSHPRFGKIAIPGEAIKLSESPGEIRSAAPDLGQHTDEVLSEVLDYDKDYIRELRSSGVI